LGAPIPIDPRVGLLSLNATVILQTVISFFFSNEFVVIRHKINLQIVKQSDKKLTAQGAFQIVALLLRWQTVKTLPTADYPAWYAYQPATI